MPIAPKKPPHQLINVHQVEGDKDAIIYLKNADHDVVEGLFFTAKRYGLATFDFQGVRYDLIRQRDFSFLVRVSEEQELTPESFT